MRIAKNKKAGKYICTVKCVVGIKRIKGGKIQDQVRRRKKVPGML